MADQCALLIVAPLLLQASVQTAIAETVDAYLASNDCSAATKPTEFVFGPQYESRLVRRRRGIEVSTSDIYRIACRASAAGWKRFAVFDDFTKRQLAIGRGRLDLDKIIGLAFLLVDIDQQATTGSSADERGCVMRRCSLSQCLNLMLDLKKPVKEMSGHHTPKADDTFRLFRSGVSFFDPFRPAFSANASVSTEVETLQAVDDTLSRVAVLPNEIKLTILDQLDILTSPDAMSAAPPRIDVTSGALEIHLLSQCSDEQLENLKASLRKPMQELGINVEPILHPWKGRMPATRCDLLRLWQRFLQHSKKAEYTSLFFTYPDTWVDQLGVIADRDLNHRNYPTTAERLPIKDALRRMYHLWIDQYGDTTFGQPAYPSRWCFSLSGRSSELLLDPRKGFFFTPEWEQRSGKGAVKCLRDSIPATHEAHTLAPYMSSSHVHYRSMMFWTNDGMPDESDTAKEDWFPNELLQMRPELDMLYHYEGPFRERYHTVFVNNAISGHVGTLPVVESKPSDFVSSHRTLEIGWLRSDDIAKICQALRSGAKRLSDFTPTRKFPVFQSVEILQSLGLWNQGSFASCFLHFD